LEIIKEKEVKSIGVLATTGTIRRELRAKLFCGKSSRSNCIVLKLPMVKEWFSKIYE
jgi:glutamate racemase